MTTAVAAPFRFFALQVARTRRLGPSLVRVTFTGPELRDFRSDGRDQSLSLFLPQPGQSEPVVPLEQGWGSPRSSEAESGGGWWQGWRELPDDVRAVMRSYTLRELRTDAGGHTTEVDIDRWLPRTPVRDGFWGTPRPAPSAPSPRTRPPWR
ncbi:siderophore-interacting protein, partial [Streptomyces sp. NPDC004976]